MRVAVLLGWILPTAFASDKTAARAWAATCIMAAISNRLLRAGVRRCVSVRAPLRARAKLSRLPNALTSVFALRTHAGHHHRKGSL